ncbi:MAG: hypothetical protein AAB497_03600 [Patescibacteria group bacterium]
MKNVNVAKILATIVILMGILVVFGWMADIQVIKSILPQWIPMRFITAVTFIFAGISLYYIAKTIDKDEGISSAVVPVMSMIILFIMGIFLVSIFSGSKTGLDGFFIKETPSEIKAFPPGFPSTGVIISFIIFSIAGIVTVLSPKNIKIYLKLSGWIMTAIGVVGIIGYIIGSDILTYNIPGFSSTIAFLAAVLIVLLGYGLVLLGKEKEAEMIQSL